MTSHAGLWYDDCWEVPGIKRGDTFFAALADLLPFPVYLCFECTGMAPDVRALLQSHAVEPPLQIRTGTLWPKPSVFHVQASDDFIREMVRVASVHAEPEFCDHFHAYDGEVMLLQWYDAFVLPLLVNASIPEPSLRRFCDRLSVSFRRRT
jgi:hypothetical protein